MKSKGDIIKTERLILRPYKEEDAETFIKLNSDPRVMEFFPAPLSREATLEAIKSYQEKIEERGWGWWAASVPGVADCIGFIGLGQPPFEINSQKVVEIGWRLAHEHWGKGYATEGALACLEYAFEKLKLPDIVSFTTVKNIRSRSVMEKIGMHHDSKDDFDNPRIAEGHPLRRHVLYRMSASDYFNKKK